MLCIIYSLASLGLIGAVMVAVYPIGWALGDLYEKRKAARVAAAAAPAAAQKPNSNEVGAAHALFAM